MSIDINEIEKAEGLARQCTQAIARILEPGMSEADAASLMREWLKTQGVQSHLHRPLAWFGPRTMLSGRSGWLPRPGIQPDYFPSTRTLSKGMAYALYCAPRLKHAVAESLHCDHLGPNPDYAYLVSLLEQLQQDLCQAIGSGHTLAQLEAGLHGFASRHSLQLRHKRLPIAHWIRPYDRQPDTGYANQRLVDKLASMTGNPMPAHLPSSGVPLKADTPLQDGLWVVQPWLTSARAGAGFRSLLKVEDGSAVWLNPPVSAADMALSYSA